jgi:hypothetical protein
MACLVDSGKELAAETLPAPAPALGAVAVSAWGASTTTGRSGNMNLSTYAAQMPPNGQAVWRKREQTEAGGEKEGHVTHS